MRLVFLDLETGGLDWSRHPITQIAAVAVDEQLNELGTFEVKLTFDPAAADQDALEKNHYSREVWDREAREPLQALRGLSLFLKGFADTELISRAGRPYYVAQLAGYNAAVFDGPFLQEFYRRHDLFLPAAFRVLDVLQRVQWHFHERPEITPPDDFKLGTVCDYLCVPLEGAHDALADVRATVGVYRALKAEVQP